MMSLFSENIEYREVREWIQLMNQRWCFQISLQIIISKFEKKKESVSNKFYGSKYVTELKIYDHVKKNVKNKEGSHSNWSGFLQ